MAGSPEARGSSARVFSGLLRDAQGKTVPAAIKLMRMDKVDYALPLFREEVLVLNAMRGVPGITPLLECGFLTWKMVRFYRLSEKQASTRPWPAACCALGLPQARSLSTRLKRASKKAGRLTWRLSSVIDRDNLLAFAMPG